MQILADMGLGVSVNGLPFRNYESLQMVREIPLEKPDLEKHAP